MASPREANVECFVSSDGIRLTYCIDDFTAPWKKAPVLLHRGLRNNRRNPQDSPDNSSLEGTRFVRLTPFDKKFRLCSITGTSGIGFQIG